MSERLVIVIEYNAMFGPDVSVTVPYRPDFAWDKAHWSWVYFEASLRGLVSKAEETGYTFVGCESHGANAFFVRKDVAGGLQQLSVEEGFVPSTAPVARTEEGSLDPWKTREQKHVTSLTFRCWWFRTASRQPSTSSGCSSSEPETSGCAWGQRGESQFEQELTR